jgi:hypothetical protein
VTTINQPVQACKPLNVFAELNAISAAERLAARSARNTARLSRDPSLRSAALREARRCQRIANRLGELMRNIG